MGISLPIVILGFILCVSLMGLSCKTNSNIPRNEWAILVGVGEYKQAFVTNQYGDNDATALCEQLRAMFGYDHIKLLVDLEATKSNIKTAICNWLEPQERKNDIILFFFAGHGNAEYLCPYDWVEMSHENDISSSELSEWLSDLDSQNIVIILDSCGSGNLANGLSKLSHEILTCGSDNEICWQENLYKHGIFSFHLIEALSHLDAVDANQDCAVSVEELFYYVDIKIASEFEAYPPLFLQHPQIISHCPTDLVLFQILNQNPSL